MHEFFPVSPSSWNHLMAVRSVEMDQRGGEEGAGGEMRQEVDSEERGRTGGREEGWIDEGLQQWVAEQHESECGPQPGHSRGSLLITERQSRAEAEAAPWSTTWSTFHSCLLSSACSAKVICFRIHCWLLAATVRPALLPSRLWYFHASASLEWSLWVFCSRFQFSSGGWPLTTAAGLKKSCSFCDSVDVGGLYVR